MTMIRPSKISGILLLLWMSSSLTACKIGLEDLVSVQGSGKTVTEVRKLGSFSAIDLEGSSNIEVTQGAVQSVTITADDNVAPLITTTIKNGKLTVSSSKSYSTHNDISIVIVVPKIEAVAVNGSGDIELTQLDSNKLSTILSGSGNITLEGRANNFTATVMGSGDIDAEKLLTKKAIVKVMGSGSMVLNASDTLDADVTGSGDVSYAGSAKVNTNITGSGSISPI